MIKVDLSDSVRVVSSLDDSSRLYLRQFILWLGVGAAGGAVAMLSFAANLPDPDRVLRAMLPSMACFVIGIITAGASLLLASRRDNAAAEHYGQAFNREQTTDALKQMPEFFSSSSKQADELNRERTKIIAQNLEFHERAESAWARRSRWHLGVVSLITVSSLAFVIGISWPMVVIASGKHLVGPRVSTPPTTASGTPSWPSRPDGRPAAS